MNLNKIQIPNFIYFFSSIFEMEIFQPAPCTNEATGEWSISVMKQKLNSLTDSNCGFRHAVSCLKSGGESATYM